MRKKSVRKTKLQDLARKRGAEYNQDIQGRFERLREQTMPLAKARGYRTDEDIFRNVL